MSRTDYWWSSSWESKAYFLSGIAPDDTGVITWTNVFRQYEATGTFQLQNCNNSTQYRILIKGRFSYDLGNHKKGDRLKTTLPLPDDAKWTTHVDQTEKPHPFITVTIQFDTNQDGISNIKIKLPYHVENQPHILTNALIEAHKHHVRSVFECVRAEEARATVRDDYAEFLTVNYPGLHISPTYQYGK